MSGKIPPEFIDQLLTRINVVDVINAYVPLKKAGSEYKACCPFHEEKTPSFTVSPSKQFYHCFGCGAHGSAIGFLMEYDHLSFPEAIETLAESIGMEVPREAGFRPGPDHRPLYQLLEQASLYYQQQLKQHEEAQNYLRQRGLSQEVIDRYDIGFAPEGWDHILQHCSRQEDSTRLLAQSGLISDKDGKQYDRFRKRIMFPIHDTRGRVIGFGGRIIGQGEPKYLNSPETPVFHKGQELYGLYQAQKTLKQQGFILVVEGYMDVVALAQYGIPNAVATLGTATTPEHIKKIFRYTHDLVFCFDGDRAGKAAAWKALETCLPLLRDGHQVRFLFLDENEDPDSQVRKQGHEAFLELIKQATPLSRFLFDKLSEEVDMSTLDGRARLASLAQPRIQQLPESLFKDMMLRQLRKLTGAPTASPAPARTRFQHHSISSTNMKPLHRAIALLLQYPELGRLPDLPQNWIKLNTSGARLLAQLLEIIHKNPHANTAALVEHWEDENIRRHLARLANTPLEVFDDQAEQFIGCLDKLGREAQKHAAQHLKQKLRPSDMSEEEKNLLRQLYSTKGGLQ